MDLKNFQPKATVDSKHLHFIRNNQHINRFKSEEGFKMNDKCDSVARIDVVKKLVNCANEIPSDGIFGSEE